MDKRTLVGFLDLANHHQDATPDKIKDICGKVKKYGFHAAFVNPCYITLAKNLGVRVGTVVSFPLGQDNRDVKILMAINAARLGVDELDICMNVGLFKAGLPVQAGKTDEVLEEMTAITETVKNLKPKIIVKFIIETGCLSAEQIKNASKLVLESGADYVKTCSGMGPRGASLEDVRLIKEAIGDKIKIKVAGGIDTLKEATDFISAGVSRIGTSKAVEIIEEL